MFGLTRRELTFTSLLAALALVFTMGGGAWAAKYLITSPNQIKPSVLKKLKGKPGAPGRAGATGAPGATGPPGASGKDGAPGAPGKDGAAGKNGTSVVSTVEPKGVNCSEGGSKFVAGSSTTFACNGKEGSPWSAGGTLPSGESLYGRWTLGLVPPELEAPGIPQFVSISFGIPTAASPTLEILAEGEDETTECPGTAAAPEAAEGFLCVYTAMEQNIVAVFPENEASEVGAWFALVGGPAAAARGTWAVTAE